MKNTPFALVLLAILPAMAFSADAGHHDHESMAEHLREDRGTAFDTHFLMVVTHHHRDAIEMFKVANQKAQHLELRTMAERMSKKQSDEAERMITMLKGRGKELAQPHGHFKARGDAVKARLEGASGAEVDRVILEELIKHHEAGIAAADLAQTNAEGADLKDLAATMSQDQRQEVERMRAWRKEWFGEGRAPETEPHQHGDGRLRAP